MTVQGDLGPDAVLLCLPSEAGGNAMAFVVSGNAVVWSGPEADLSAQFEGEALSVVPVIVIVPAAHSTFRRVAAKGLEPKQEIAVAKIRAGEEAIGEVQTAAGYDADGRVALATVDRLWLQTEVERLMDSGLNVVAAVPEGALFKPPAGELWRGQIADEAVLYHADFASLDEPELASILSGALAAQDIAEAEMARAVAAIATARQPDFLEGLRLRRPSSPLFDDESRRWAKRLAVLAVALLVAAVLVHWARTEWATSRENARGLAAAQQIDPAIKDIETAETAVNAAMARKGIARGEPSMLVAVVWQAVRANENVALTTVNLQPGGLLNATMAAPDSASVNAALIAIQRAGYAITATPRRDQSGATLVDLTVRVP